MSPCILKIYVTYNTIKRFRPQVEVNFRCYIFTHAYYCCQAVQCQRNCIREYSAYDSHIMISLKNISNNPNKLLI
jgi:hypothetical protein